MKVNCIIFFVFALVLASSAQIAPNDFVSTGADNTDMVFYELSTGTKTTSSNTDWHLAISIRPTEFPGAPLGGTTIRINEANGVHAIYVPNANASQFDNVDTTGWGNWGLLHDADSILDEGALNSNRSAGIFDFGWGNYNSVSHDVTGDSLYLIQLPNGELKKFMVVVLDRDTAYNIKYSDINNSNVQTLHISKRDYIGKNFVYLNMQTNVVYDKEPLSANWDLLFTKYAARDAVGGEVIAKVGVLANKGRAIGKATGTDAALPYFTGSTSSMMNAIGWNWCTYNNQNDEYVAADSLAYFIKDAASFEYKLVLTNYEGPSTGIIRFNKQDNMATGIESVTSINVNAYPNPANNSLTITSDAITTAHISDLNGRVIDTIAINEGSNTYATSTLANGMYILSLGNGQAVKKLIIQH